MREQTATVAIDTVDRELADYLRGSSVRPLFICGNALEMLRSFPSESVDCCMTSPPYWGQRQYAVSGIGLEDDYKDYVSQLSAVFTEHKRVLKNTGSFWLNIGDT